jgi:hypothetical protein
MSTFGARVQYGDWHGDCKADNLDLGGLRKVLRERGLITDGDFIIGFTAWNGENGEGLPLDPVDLSVYVVRAWKYEEARRIIDESDPIPARRIRLEMTPDEFLHIFKRFSIALSWQDFPLHGREIVIPQD